MKRYEQFNKVMLVEESVERQAFGMIEAKIIEDVENYIRRNGADIDYFDAEGIGADTDYFELYNAYIEWLNEEVEQ